MRALLNDKNLCNDRWLAALVDAMDEIEADRADDICRASNVPAGLVAQLYGRAVPSQRVFAPRFELV
jgi:hypothetical protein